MYQRIKLKQALVDQLKGKTRAGDRVFFPRKRTLDAKSLPCLVVRSVNEEIESETADLGFTFRKLNFEISALLSSRNPEIELDNFSQEVDRAIRQDRSLSYTSNDIKLKRISFESEYVGTTVIAMALMEYEVEYSVQEQEIQTPILKTLIINGVESNARFN